MSILRKETRGGYTHVANDLCDADGLSFRARGICLVLLSKPNDWDVNIRFLMQIGKEGEQAIRTAMHELAEYGFMMRVREQDAQGRLRTVTLVADYPAYIGVGTVQTRINGYDTGVTDLAQTDMAVSGTSVETDLAETETSENRRSENRDVGKCQVIVNTEVPITDLLTTEEEETESNGYAVDGADAAAPPVSFSEPLPEKSNVAKPDLKEHPCVKAYHDLHNRYPTRAQMALIAERDPPFENWVRAIRAWSAAGYKPTNFTGMLEGAENPALIATWGAKGSNGHARQRENRPEDYTDFEVDAGRKTGYGQYSTTFSALPAGNDPPPDHKGGQTLKTLDGAQSEAAP